MKFTLIVVLAGLCLAAVSAHGVHFREANDVAFEYVPEDNADGIVDVEAFGFLSVVKAALRTVKGVNCSIKAALIMKTAAQQCLTDLQACGGQVSKQVQNVINVLNTIISICNNIINLNQNVCNVSGDSDSSSTSNSCFVKLVKQMYSLYKNIQKCLTLIKKIPTAGANASDCVTTAVTQVSNTFTQFPTYITNCSKLTSN